MSLVNVLIAIPLTLVAWVFGVVFFYTARFCWRIGPRLPKIVRAFKEARRVEHGLKRYEAERDRRG